MGSPDRYRYILVAVASGIDTGEITESLTVAGVTATFLGRYLYTSSGANAPLEYFIAAVPDGATGDVVVDVAAVGEGLSERCSISVYRIIHYRMPQVFHSNSSSLASANLNVNTPAGKSFIVGVAYGASIPNAMTWTGLTSNHFTQIATSGRYISSASYLSIDQQTPRTVSLSITDATYDTSYVMVLR